MVTTMSQATTTSTNDKETVIQMVENPMENPESIQKTTTMKTTTTQNKKKKTTKVQRIFKRIKRTSPKIKNKTTMPQ